MAEEPSTVGADAVVEGSEPEVRAREKSMTIGAVCKALGQEFPDISISKIRYLEDQKLLAPRRTPGGYRLYSAADVARLRTILRLQRDEFLPAAGHPPGARHRCLGRGHAAAVGRLAPGVGPARACAARRDQRPRPGRAVLAGGRDGGHARRADS